MKWTIVADSISGAGDVSRVGRGPKKLPFRFRLKDDDGIIYYEGRSDDCTSQDAFAPLDWARADAGCTTIEYWTDNTGWQVL